MWKAQVAPNRFIDDSMFKVYASSYLQGGGGDTYDDVMDVTSTCAKTHDTTKHAPLDPNPTNATALYEKILELFSIMTLADETILI